MRCPSCKAGNPRKVKEDLTWTLELAEGPAEVVIEGVPGWRCDECGETYRRVQDLERAELTAAAALASSAVRDGAVLRFMRKAMGLKASQLAELLDVTPETISRWENNKGEADLGAWVTVAALVTERLEGKTATRDRLAELKKRRRRPERPLRLPLAPA